MRHKSIFAALSLVLACTHVFAVSTIDYTKFVNPFIGTLGGGNTYPGAQAPHGMVQLSPDNGLPGWDRIAGYYYPDSTIAGFSHTHLSGTGAGDLYDISFMPATRPLNIADTPLGLHSKFSHDSEEARAGYYKVHLDDYNIDVELTATERVGLQRYTSHADTMLVVLNLEKATNWDNTLQTKIEVIDSVTICGYRYSDGWARNQKVWFATRFSKPFNSVQYNTKDGGIAQFSFVDMKNDNVVLATALSCTSVSEALNNMHNELSGNIINFGKTMREAKDKWNAELSRIEIETDNDDLKTVFYTALYHSLIAPTIYSDASGKYLGPDGKVHNTSDGRVNYSTFSLWDTYRAAHPLYTIIAPSRAADMAQSLVDFARQLGRMPVWNMWASETDMMIGYHSVPVVVDAILKGIYKPDLNDVLDLCVKTAEKDDYRSLGLYRKLGFVPCDRDSSWSMSKTLEYAYDDYCIALLAAKAGNKTVQKEFERRGKFYKNTFNPQTGFMQPRKSDGSFVDNFNPLAYTDDICESNAWHYLWSVQQDIPGLAKLLGGYKKFADRLDTFFTLHDDSIELPLFSTGMIGQYVHGNEPSHHVAYLYNYAGQPHKTQYYIDRILSEQYSNAPEGLCGNEDCGQMSAWYIFSALGFYPVDPVSGEYQLGAPLFTKATIHLEDGKTFVISAPKRDEQNIYAKNISLNGKKIKGLTLRHTDIMRGGELKFDMTATK
jgi:predicted alpha-1,2-mannosidase